MKKILIPILYLSYFFASLLASLIPVQFIRQRKIIIGGIIISALSINSGCRIVRPTCHRTGPRPKRHNNIQHTENKIDSNTKQLEV